MKLTDKEALKVLAEAVRDSFYVYDPDGSDYCSHCNITLSWHEERIHKEDCPVLLAEEILNESN